MTSTMNVAAAAVLGVAMIAPTPVEARTWYITPTGSGDAPTVRAAIDSAETGDTILVAAGTYSWTTQGGDTLNQRYTGPSLIRMTLRHGITLRSESGPAVTILDAEGRGRVIFLEGATNVQIGGFTIRDGRAANPYGLPDWRGIGHGGGVLCRASANITIEDNIIVENYAQNLGGGLVIADVQPCKLSLNIVARNQAHYGRSGGIEVGGATSNVEIRGNTIVENRGTGISCSGAGAVAIAQNIIASNQYNLNNNAGGHGIYCIDTQPIVSCSDIWGNAVSNSVCGSDASGNFSADPHFCLRSGEYHLRSDSACLPENNSCNQLIGARSVGCTLTDSEGTSGRVVLTLDISPNPVHRQSTILYSVPRDSRSARILVYDLRGRVVAQIPAGARDTAASVVWDGHDASGAAVSAGVYVVRLLTDRGAAMKKLVIMK